MKNGGKGGIRLSAGDATNMVGNAKQKRVEEREALFPRLVPHLSIKPMKKIPERIHSRSQRKERGLPGRVGG